MTVTYDKDGAYIEITENGVTYRRSIKWDDCLVSFPTSTKLRIDRTYVDDSDQLVIVLSDESEITVTGGVVDHGDLTGVTTSQHHTKYTDTEALAAAKAALDYGLSFEGIVTTVTDATHFKVATLADKGTGFFKPVAGAPYEVYVVEADGAAPEGEQTPVVAYTTADGTFQHTAFTDTLAVGDIVLIQHPAIAALGTKATATATGAVTETDYLMAYLKQVVTELQVVDALIDAITAAGPTKTQMDTAHALLATVAKQDIIDGIVDAILVDTGTTLPATLATIAAYLDTEIAAIKAVTDVLPDSGALTTLQAAVDAIPTAPALASSWTAALAIVLGNYTAARAGYLDELAAANLPTDVTTIDTVVDGIQTDLSNATDGLGALKALIDTLQATANAITAAGPTKVEMDTAHALLATIAKQDVIDGIVDNILIDTAVIGALGAGLTAIPWNSAWDTEVQSEAADALTAYDPPTRAEATADKDAVIAAIPAMVGTDSAALASVLGALNDVAASGAVTDIDTVMQYIKQLVTAILLIPTTAMRGTDGAALASAWTAALATVLANYTAARAGYLDNINQVGLLQVTVARAALLDQITAVRLAELDAANIPADVDTIKANQATIIALTAASL